MTKRMELQWESNLHVEIIASIFNNNVGVFEMVSMLTFIINCFIKILVYSLTALLEYLYYLTCPDITWNQDI